MDADLVFDVRFLPNPHFVPRLRPKTGRDRAVVKFMEDSRATVELLARLNELLKFLVPQFVAEGKSYLTIAIGLYGRPSSVGDDRRGAPQSARRRAGTRVRVHHRDITHE